MEQANHLILCKNAQSISVLTLTILLLFCFVLSLQCNFFLEEYGILFAFLFPFVLIAMSKFRFHSNAAARIFGPRANVCAEASSSPTTVYHFRVSFDVGICCLLSLSSLGLLVHTSSCLQNSLILPTFVPAKPV